jgi:hypothetical protein
LNSSPVQEERKTMANELPLPLIVLASKNGPPHLLQRLLQQGGDPNSDDGYGGTCLIASACYSQPECARLLIQYGADVTYAYNGDNATLLYMMAYCFCDGEALYFNEGDYILTADILINAGAPITERSDGRTALEVLQEMQVAPGTAACRERDGLMSLLQRQYWRASGARNPFLHASSPQDSVLLFMMGAANSDDGSMDSTRVRSIPPNSRHSVLQALYDHEDAFHAFMHILFVVQQKNTATSYQQQQQHPLRLFH